MSLTDIPVAKSRKRLFVYLGALVFAILITLGVFAKNGWLASKGRVTSDEGKGFFSSLVTGHSSLPNPTPQLSKEYIHAAGGRLLAIEDANANAAPPADLAVWRPSTGTWWVMGGQYSQGATQTWGLPDDRPVPGDYS
jgi:hypothetical protein